MIMQNQKKLLVFTKKIYFYNDLTLLFTKDSAYGNARGDIGNNTEKYLHKNITLDNDAGYFQMPIDELMSSCLYMFHVIIFID